MTAILVCKANEKIYYLDPNVKERVFKNKTALVNYLVSHSAPVFSDGGAARKLEDSWWQTKRVWFSKGSGAIIELSDLQKDIRRRLHDGEFLYFRKENGEIIEIDDLLMEISKGRVFTSDDGALWLKYKRYWSNGYDTYEFGRFVDLCEVLSTDVWRRYYWFHDKSGRTIDVKEFRAEEIAEIQRRRKLRRRKLNRPSRGTGRRPHAGDTRCRRSIKSGRRAYLRDFTNERILRMSNQHQYFWEYFEFFEHNSRWEYDDLGNLVWVCGNPAWVCEDYLENKDRLEYHGGFWTFCDDEGNLLYRWKPRGKFAVVGSWINDWDWSNHRGKRSFGWKDHKCRRQWEHRVREQEKHRKNRERKAVRRRGYLTENESDSESLI